MIKVKDLKDQIGQTGPRTFLRCNQCASEYSANSGDYFNCTPDMVFMCCDVPMLRVIKHVSYEQV